MLFEQWINCRLGFDISIPRFVVGQDVIVKQARLTIRIFGQRRRCAASNTTRSMEIPTAAGLALAASKTSPGQRVSKANSARPTLLPLGYPASVVTEIGRTIERRLIRTLHLVEWSIPRFRIDCLGLSEGRRTSHLIPRLPGDIR